MIWFRRIVAQTIDVVIISSLSLSLSFFFELSGESAAFPHAFFWILWIYLFCSYRFLNGATIGKYWLGLRVYSIHGNLDSYRIAKRLSIWVLIFWFPAICGNIIFHYTSYNLNISAFNTSVFYASILLFYLTIILGLGKYSLSDLLSGTYVDDHKNQNYSNKIRTTSKRIHTVVVLIMVLLMYPPIQYGFTQTLKEKAHLFFLFPLSKHGEVPVKSYGINWDISNIDLYSRRSYFSYKKFVDAVDNEFNFGTLPLDIDKSVVKKYTADFSHSVSIVDHVTFRGFTSEVYNRRQIQEIKAIVETLNFNLEKTLVLLRLSYQPNGLITFGVSKELILIPIKETDFRVLTEDKVIALDDINYLVLEHDAMYIASFYFTPLNFGSSNYY